MSSNKTLRATVAFLIDRDEAHEMAFAKALETLGIDWGKALPISKFDASQFPEVKKLIDLGINREQYTFRLDGSETEYQTIFPLPRVTLLMYRLRICLTSSLPFPYLRLTFPIPFS